MDSGEVDAFARAYGQQLVRLAYAIGGDMHRAEDAAQHALEKLFQARNRVQDPLAYTRQVAVNAVRESWRKHAAVEVGPSEGREPEHLDAALAEVDSEQWLLQALWTLPQRQRAVIVLRYWLDLSERETATTMRISVGSVKQHNARALAALRSSFSPADS